LQTNQPKSKTVSLETKIHSTRRSIPCGFKFFARKEKVWDYLRFAKQRLSLLIGYLMCSKFLSSTFSVMLLEQKA